MPELAEEFVIKGDGPVLAEELDDVGNEPGVIPPDDLVEVLDVEADEGVEGGYNDLFAAQIGHSLDHPVGVDHEPDVVPLELFDVLGN